MSAPNFAVEQIKQAALVVGEQSSLRELFVNKLAGQGIAVFFDPQQVGDDYDLDYCLSLDQLPPPGLAAIRQVAVLPWQGKSAKSKSDNTLLLYYPQLVGEGAKPSEALISLLKSTSTVASRERISDQPFPLLHQQDLVDYSVSLLLGRQSNLPQPLAAPDSPTQTFVVDQFLSQQAPHHFLPNLSHSLSQLTSDFEFRPTLEHLFPLIKSVLGEITMQPPPPPKPAPEKHLKPLPRPTSHSTPKKLVFVPINNSTTVRPTLSHRSRIMLQGVIIGFALYLTSFIFVATISLLTFRQLFNSLASSSLPTTQVLNLSDWSSRYLEINLVAFSSVPKLGNAAFLQNSLALISNYRQGIAVAVSLGEISRLSQDINNYILGGADHDLTALLDKIKLELGVLYDKLSLLDASLQEEPPSLLKGSYRETYLKLSSSLGNLRRAVLSGKSILDVAPDLLGLGSRRKYLVLFQNNMELRATGGFIGSFAILSFENGHLYDMPIYDVYTADGQLKGHVEPPQPIKDILGEANWYLRDSNWDPDFPVSSRRAEWFLKKTMNIEVQGTIGINIYSLSDILRAIGPINLPDYNEQISADNIFEKAEYYSEVNFFPGSTGKKEILSSIASNLLNTLHSLSSNNSLAVLKAIIEGIDSKHTLISLSSPLTSRAFSTLGWDGGVQEPDCPTLGDGDCLSDYAYLVESNFGVNKANYFLERRLYDEIKIDNSGNISHSLQINYTNKAKSLTWPAGNYKNYFRLYLPASINISSLVVNDRYLDSQDYELYSEHGKTVVGALVEVPINSSVNVTVNYKLASPLNLNSATYSYYWQKQSGTADDPLSFKLSYSDNFQPEIISPKAVLNQGFLEFNLVNNTDRRITIKFK